MLDGSIQGWTAKMGWPGYYTGTDHGVWMTAPEQVLDMCRPFHERGINIHAHCNGDLTIDLWIDTVEQLRARAAVARPPAHGAALPADVAGPVPTDGQARACAPTSSPTTSGTGATSTTTSPSDPSGRGGWRRVAPPNARACSFSIHSDANVTPLGHLHTMWCAVNRVTPSGRVLGPDERISAESALRVGDARLGVPAAPRRRVRLDRVREGGRLHGARRGSARPSTRWRSRTSTSGEPSSADDRSQRSHEVGSRSTRRRT